MLTATVVGRRPPLRMGSHAIAAQAADIEGEGLVGDVLTYAIWNSADKSANITLTETDHLATGADTDNGGVRGDQFRDEGQWYFEVEMNANDGSTAVGLARGDADLTTIGSAITDAVMAITGGGVFLDEVFQFNIGILGTNTVAVAYDADAHLVWFRRNNEFWNADEDADPETGIGGLDVSSIDDAGLYPAFASGTTGDFARLNTGDSAFSFTKPVGFLPWLGGSVISGPSGAGALVASAAVIDGTGTSGSTGTGDLDAGAVTVEGEGSLGNTGALVADAATIDGTGTTASTGTGSLAAGAATVDGTGDVEIETSYANTGGTGDRTSIITVSRTGVTVSGSFDTLIINGNTSENTFWMTGGANGSRIIFDFGSGNAVVIDTFKWYQSNNQNHGTWKWVYSDDGSSWSDVGSSFTLDGNIGGAGKEFAQPAGNTTAKRYYALEKVSGTISSGPFIREIEFKIFGL